MSQFINIKKLTANTLFGVLLTGGLIVESSNTRVEASSFASCNNNGHGNNAYSTVYFNLDSDGSEAYVRVQDFDPSNPSNQKRNKLIAALRDKDNERNGIDIDYSGYSGSGLTANEALYVANNVEDLEENCDSDGDGYNDATEGQEDIDGDGIPNYMDADSSHMSNTITLTGTIRDFQASHPDFEFNLDDGDGGSQTTGLDTGIVTDTIGADKKPVYAHGNGSTTTTNGETNFNQWYNDVSGVNQSKQHSITLVEQTDGTYQYSSNNFFPINDELFGNIKNDPSITTPTSGWMANQWNNGKKNNNYHFTYELHHSFTYQAGEDQEFTFSGDDDVWVYINGQRVIDIGGVHAPETRTVNLDDLASELGLVDGGTYDFDFFFAERNFSGSNFTITTSIELEPEAPTLTTLPTPPVPTPTNPNEVSVELVLSVDVSTSVSKEEFELQRDGYISAFEDSTVRNAITTLPKGMAVNMQFWASDDVADTGWFVLRSAADIDTFIAKIEGVKRTGSYTDDIGSRKKVKIDNQSSPVSMGGGTDIKMAIEEATNLLTQNTYVGDRLVIDISGDGLAKNSPYAEAQSSLETDGYRSNECGYLLVCPPVEAARDAAIAQGITINGLPINNTLTYKNVTDWLGNSFQTDEKNDVTDDYYRTNVVGGTGSFVQVAESFEDFEEAVKLKILREINNDPTDCISGIPCDPVENPNTPPVASNDNGEVEINSAITIDVLANDYDADGDSITFTAEKSTHIDANSGSIAINGNNQIVYTAPPTPGTYTFMYRIEDGNGGVDTGEVTVEALPYSD